MEADIEEEEKMINFSKKRVKKVLTKCKLKP